MELSAETKTSEIGLVRKDWPEDSLDSCIRKDAPICYGILMPGTYFRGGIPVIKVKDIYGGRIDESDLLLTNPSLEEPYRRSRLAKGDVLITIRGTTGRVAIVPFSLDGANITQDTARLRTNGRVLSEFLFHVLQSPQAQLQIALQTIGQAVKGINIRDVKELKIPIPTPPEQKAISNVLSDADAYIESLEKLIAKKRLIKKGVMHELLTGKRRLGGEKNKNNFKKTELGLIPEDWCLKSVSQIGEVGRGRVISHNEIAKSYNSIYPVYSSQTSNQGIMGFIDTYDFEGEFITWTTDGANAGTVFHRNGRFNCTNVCGTIKTFKDDARFISYQLGNYAKSYVSRHLGNPKLMNDVMKKVQIPVPSNLNEQKEISNCISDLESELNQFLKKLEKARLLKQGMMQELLTGRIRLV